MDTPLGGALPLSDAKLWSTLATLQVGWAGGKTRRLG